MKNNLVTISKENLMHGFYSESYSGGKAPEAIYAFGGLCMIDSIEEICHLNDICDRLGR